MVGDCLLSSILYIISLLSLIIIFLFIKKSDNKQNLIKWLIITFGLVFCYNSLVSYLLNLFLIQINLISLTITNLLVILIIILTGIKSKNFQRYYILKRDIVAIIIFIFVLSFVCLKKFGYFNISYETSDPGVHYLTAKDFYDNLSLLNQSTQKTIVNFETRQFASYANLGIIFEVFSPFIDYFDFYKLYIIYDVFMLMLSAFMFYTLISDDEGKVNCLFLIIGTLFYIMGYPLNNLIFGFFYLGHSLIIINLILILYKYYSKNNFNYLTYIILLSITSTGLFFTYYFFVPIIYISFFVYLIYNSLIKQKKLCCKKNLIFLLLIIILPSIAGFFYFIYPNLGNPNQNFIYQLSLDGFCYVDIINNFILFLPIIFYYIIYLIKDNRVNLECLIFIFSLLFVTLILILILNKMASIYYLSKIFYLIWFISFYLIFEFIYDVFNKTISFNFPVTLLCCIILFISFLFRSNFVSFTKDHSDDKYNTIFGIYKYNLDKIIYPTVILRYDEMEELKLLYNNGIRNIYSNAIPYARVWLTSYFETKKIDYPENQLYNYIMDNYFFNIDLDELPCDHYVILFYRKSILKFFYNQNNNEFNKNFYDEYIKKCDNCKFKYYNTFLLVDKK